MSGDSMADFVTALTNASTGITGSNLWAEVAGVAGLITTIVLFSFGYRVISKAIKGAAKGKVRL